MKNDLVKHCFEEHKKDFNGDIKFTYEEYLKFWVNCYPKSKYEMRNRDGTYSKCHVVYYPLPYYKDLRALIELDQNDLREVPVHFLRLIKSIRS